jgi:hypothetical protein
MIAFQLPDFLVSLAVRGLLIGSAIGFIPLVLGLIRRRRSLAVYGFASSAVGGALLSGIVSLVAAAVFVWLILRKPAGNVDPVSAVAEASDSELPN